MTCLSVSSPSHRPAFPKIVSYFLKQRLGTLILWDQFNLGDLPKPTKCWLDSFLHSASFSPSAVLNGNHFLNADNQETICRTEESFTSEESCTM